MKTLNDNDQPPQYRRNAYDARQKRYPIIAIVCLIVAIIAVVAHVYFHI